VERLSVETLSVDRITEPELRAHRARRANGTGLLWWVAAFAVLAIVSAALGWGALGFGGLAAGVMSNAKLLFVGSVVVVGVLLAGSLVRRA
jgi:hypothetical protein